MTRRGGIYSGATFGSLHRHCHQGDLLFLFEPLGQDGNTSLPADLTHRVRDCPARLAGRNWATSAETA